MLLEIRVCVLGNDPAIKAIAQEIERAGAQFKKVVLHEVPSDLDEPYRLQFTIFDGDTIEGWSDSVNQFLTAFGAKISALKGSNADVAFAYHSNPEGSEPYVWLNAEAVRRLAEFGLGLAFELSA